VLLALDKRPVTLVEAPIRGPIGHPPRDPGLAFAPLGRLTPPAIGMALGSRPGFVVFSMQLTYFRRR
jgi:hypothetical protein